MAATTFVTEYDGSKDFRTSATRTYAYAVWAWRTEDQIAAEGQRQVSVGFAAEDVARRNWDRDRTPGCSGYSATLKGATSQAAAMQRAGYSTAIQPVEVSTATERKLYEEAERSAAAVVAEAPVEVTAEDVEFVATAIERVQAETAVDEEPALTQAECEALDAGTETEAVEEAAPATVREGGVHAACDHENTSAGRRACRRARRKAGLPQLADAR